MSLFNPVDPSSGWTAWDYGNAICHYLKKIAEGVNEGESEDVKRLRRPFVITLDASGNGSAVVDLSPGLEMNLLTYAFQMAAAPAGGYFAFYRDIEEGTTLIEVTPAGQVVADNFNADGHYIPEQSRLLVIVRGSTANAVVSGNVTAKASILGSASTRDTAESGEFA